MTKFSFRVKLSVPNTTGESDPDNARHTGYKPTREQVRRYVKEAINDYGGGQRHYTDPFFHVEGVEVK